MYDDKSGVSRWSIITTDIEILGREQSISEDRVKFSFYHQDYCFEGTYFPLRTILQEAILQSRTTVVGLLLDYYRVPTCNSLKERIALYQLLEKT